MAAAMSASPLRDAAIPRVRMTPAVVAVGMVLSTCKADSLFRTLLLNMLYPLVRDERSLLKLVR